MPRVARIVIPGLAHHVTQRGNNRQDVFFVDDDRRMYLALLKEQAERFGLRVEGYCLMINHVHLIVTPGRAEALAKGVGRTHFLYAQYVNRTRGRSGHLWQNRFHSCALDGEYYWASLVYVERNPVRAKIVRLAWRYPWSSAAAHVGGEDPTGVLDMAAWQRLSAAREGGDWSEALRRAGDEPTRAAIRLHLTRGRPMAGDGFLSKLERKLGRRLRPLPVGRPKKKEQNR